MQMFILKPTKYVSRLEWSGFIPQSYILVCTYWYIPQSYILVCTYWYVPIGTGSMEDAEQLHKLAQNNFAISQASSPSDVKHNWWWIVNNPVKLGDLVWIIDKLKDMLGILNGLLIVASFIFLCPRLMMIIELVIWCLVCKNSKQISLKKLSNRAPASTLFCFKLYVKIIHGI